MQNSVRCIASTSKALWPGVRRLTASALRKQATASGQPALSFPCVDQNIAREARLRQSRLGTTEGVEEEVEQSGPEPAYANIVSGYSVYHHAEPFPLDYGGRLPEFDIAYETWGKLNADKSNVVLIHTGLSASSHAHSTPENKAEGWWERFIGSGKAIDTDRFFVICTNVVGGCYGSTGPSSPDPADGKPYATRFPILSLFDMVRAQFCLLDSMGIRRLYASVGSSMGGMQSVAAAHLEPERVGRVVSISGTARSSPASIALRYAQRSGATVAYLGHLLMFGDVVVTVLMADPNWKRGFYYGDVPPHTGMKLARRESSSLCRRTGWKGCFQKSPRSPTVLDQNGSSVSGECGGRPFRLPPLRNLRQCRTIKARIHRRSSAPTSSSRRI
jgi:homoserine acetyltransferase